jgi:hypothetical protein
LCFHASTLPSKPSPSSSYPLRFPGIPVLCPGPFFRPLFVGLQFKGALLLPRRSVHKGVSASLSDLCLSLLCSSQLISILCDCIAKYLRSLHERWRKSWSGIVRKR